MMQFLHLFLYICKNQKNRIVMKAMIFAAGLGTRLRPLTDKVPKALVSIHGKTLLERTILKLKEAGIDEIIINVHHFSEQIVWFLKEKNNFGIHIELSDESDRLLDTGGGIKKVAHFLNDGHPFLIHNVDILSNIDIELLLEYHCSDCNRLSTLVVSPRDTYRYLLFNDEQMLRGWVNIRTHETRPTPNLDDTQLHKLAFAGIQMVSPAIFKLMEKEKDKFPIMEFYLKHCLSQEIAGYVPDNFKILDVGKPDAIAKAENFYSENE